MDDVFVFINIFRQSTHLKSVNKRLVYTIRTAGVATFYTSFTTAMAFASNIASSVSEPSATHFSHTLKEKEYMYSDQCLAGHLSVCFQPGKNCSVGLFVCCCSITFSNYPTFCTLVDFVDFVFTHMSGDSYRRWFPSLLLCLCPARHEEFMLPLTQSRSQGLDLLWKCVHLIEPGVTKISMFVHHNQMEMLCGKLELQRCLFPKFIQQGESCVSLTGSVCLWVWPDCVTVIDRFSVCEFGLIVWPCYWQIHCVCEFGLIVWLCYWQI